MDSTGSTTSKEAKTLMGGLGGAAGKEGKRENSLPKDAWKYLPSISEFGLNDKNNKKRLQYLFDSYLRPQQNESKTLEITKEWGRQFKEAATVIPKKLMQEETMFIMDVIIYYLYYDIVTDKTKYPKNVPIVDLPCEMIEFLIKRAQKIFEDQKALIQFEAPVKIFGDIHGQYTDLLHMFKEMQEKNKNEFQGDRIISMETRYLFMGDYVNRGKQSCEVICLLYALQCRFPRQVVILRGNHECQSITRIYGFFDEIKRRYKISLWQAFYNSFNHMPLVALIDEKIMCMHGGISMHMNSFEQIEAIPKPTDIPDEGLMADLLWNDPDDNVTDWEENERGCGYVFGRPQLQDFLRRHDLDLICRGHQVMEDGYGFFGKNKQLVTIFSAKNYCGDFDNDAAVMNVDQDLMCKFITFKGNAKKQAAKAKGAAKKKNSYYF